MEKKILIVDDEEHVLAVLENRLSKAGYSVIKATNGKDAVEMAKKELPALIICDVLMPDIDGGEVLNILRDERTTENIPIIFLTALLKEQEKGRTAGGEYFMAKPYNPDELLAEVAKRLKQA